MPKYICQFEHEGTRLYFDWSTVVDGPVSHAVPLHKYRENYQREFGEAGMRELPARIERADTKGTSSIIHDSLAELIETNRAGDGEKPASWEEIKAMVLEEEDTDVRPAGESRGD